MTSAKDQTLILGIGNTLLRDEGVGVQMLDHLQAHVPGLPQTRYLDGGTLSFTLAAWIEEAGRLIVIDAAELDARPGTVQVFEGTCMDRFAGRRKRSVHEVSLGDLLAMAHLTGSLPARRALVAIQPQRVDWGDELSPSVTAALPLAASQVVDLYRRWRPTEFAAEHTGFMAAW